MSLWAWEMSYVMRNIQWFIMSLVTHVLLSPPFLLTLMPYVPLEGFSLWLKPSQYYCNPRENATQEILNWPMKRVCLNYLALLRHELLLNCLVVMRPCSQSVVKWKNRILEFGVYNTHPLEHSCITWHMDWLSRTCCLSPWIT
jgi:hypothetical protein